MPCRKSSKCDVVAEGASNRWTFGDFVRQVYLPFYRRKWKGSTAVTNEDRVEHHLTCEFTGRMLNSFTRDGLQSFLDQKATAGLSFSTIAHLRWDLSKSLTWLWPMVISKGIPLCCYSFRGRRTGLPEDD